MRSTTTTDDLRLPSLTLTTESDCHMSQYMQSLTDIRLTGHTLFDQKWHTSAKAGFLPAGIVIPFLAAIMFGLCSMRGDLYLALMCI